MPKPPPSGPHSDITGPNRDVRAGVPSTDPDPAAADVLHAARKNSAARPDRGPHLGEGKGKGR